MSTAITTRALSACTLRRALIAGIRRVMANRDEINRINVFPVADGDTGTNLAFTLGAVLQGMREPRLTSAAAVLRQVGADAIDGARGNAGAILAHFFQGVAEGLEPGTPLTPAVLAQAAGRGASRARTALVEPREGTILSVMQAFADGVKAQAAAGTSDLRRCFKPALEHARVALRATTNQIKELKSAGVVDAGARGFVEILEGIADFIERGGRGLGAGLGDEFMAAGIDAVPGDRAAGHRYGVECVVSAERVDRSALKAALLALPFSDLVIAGSRGRVQLRAHVTDPAQLLATAARFGAVSRERTEDTLAPSPAGQARRRRVAIVTDSGADVPAEAVEQFDIHLVPQRLSIGGRDFVDGVTLSAREFFDAMRTSPIPPRTSQPPPGDFRRMFEFLLSHHEQVIDVSLGRAFSGTFQSAAGAAARTAADRISIFDSCQLSSAQGLLTLWAAEAAHLGLSFAQILEGLTRMRARTEVFAVVRDVSFAVRGGRVPRVALPLTRLLRVSLMVRSRGKGKLSLTGGLWGRQNLPERFARLIARKLNPDRRYRLVVGHCDALEDAKRVQVELVASVPVIDRIWVVETGIAIGAHAGPGSLVIGVQDYEPPTR